MWNDDIVRAPFDQAVLPYKICRYKLLPYMTRYNVIATLAPTSKKPVEVDRENDYLLAWVRRIYILKKGYTYK